MAKVIKLVTRKRVIRTGRQGISGPPGPAGPAASEAKHVHYHCRKGSAGTIARGTPLYPSGYNVGGWYEVEAADAADPAKMPAIGLAEDDITSAAEGHAVRNGELAATLDTSAWAVGTLLYVASGGGLSATPPAAGQVQAVAAVTRQDAALGELQVEIGTTSTPATQAEAEAGTETALRSWSPLRVWQTVRAAFKKITAQAWSVTDLGTLAPGAGLTLDASAGSEFAAKLPTSGTTAVSITNAPASERAYLILNLITQGTLPTVNWGTLDIGTLALAINNAYKLALEPVYRTSGWKWVVKEMHSEADA